MQGLFVTGTGTGVGKTIVAAALCAVLAAEGRSVIASKPLLSGLDEAPPTPWPHDHELLALCTGAAPEDVAPVRFGPAVSPHLAARWAGTPLQLGAVVASVRDRWAQAGAVVAAGAPAAPPPVAVVEGAGGLLVPVDDEGGSIAELALQLGLPLVIVGHPGLGTINHVLLTVEAARARGLAVAGVVLSPWPAAPSAMELDNRATVFARAGVPVFTLAQVSGPDPAELAAAGAAAGLPSLLAG